MLIITCIENDKSRVQVGEAKESDGEYPLFQQVVRMQIGLRWKATRLLNGRNCFHPIPGGNADVKFRFMLAIAAYSTDHLSVCSANQTLRRLFEYAALSLYNLTPELNKKFFQGTGLKHIQQTCCLTA